MIGNVDDLKKSVFLNHMRGEALQSIIGCDGNEPGYMLELEDESGNIIVVDNDGCVTETVTSEKIVFGDYESAQLFADKNEEKLMRYYFKINT